LSAEKAVAKARLVIPVTESDHIRGPMDAPVTLVEYGDYQCPHCRLVYHYLIQLQDQLGDRLRYVYRHLPISLAHPQAQLAAEAAEAAAAQGKFWEMHDMLYTHEQLDEAHLLAFAEEIGLDMEQFQADLTNQAYADRVRQDFEGGIRSGVNGTPNFFLNEERYDGPWDLESLLELVEKPLGVRVSLLTQQFVRQAASGGIVLLLFTIGALLWRNSAWAESYLHFWETKLSFSLGGWSLSESLLHWLNDGLMVLFFFVVGLEIKREVTSGELASARKAALPVAAAIGGMLMPAAIYLLINGSGAGRSGWGIPVATDIAFTLGILTLLGSRISLSLKIFFTALAIADDLGAILVIAVFYSAGISWASLGIAGLIFLALVGLNRARIYATWPYALLGVFFWLAFLRSGIHPTIAGVLLAAVIPSRSPAYMRPLLTQVVSLLTNFDLPVGWREEQDSQRQAVISALEKITERMRSPAQRLEETLSPIASFLILPLFALANAGVVINLDSISLLTGRVSLGIILGLLIGKPTGITLLSWLAARVGLAELPGGVSWPQFIGASCLAGIGFTMSLFISGPAFAGATELQELSKLAILLASILAAILGSWLLIANSPSVSATTPMTRGG
jgi:NhaA family Na+:H+ antiporter